MPTAATLPTGRPTKRLRDGRAKLAVAEIASDAGLSAPATSLAFGLRTVASIGEAVCRASAITSKQAADIAADVEAARAPVPKCVPKQDGETGLDGPPRRAAG